MGTYLNNCNHYFDTKRIQMKYDELRVLQCLCKFYLHMKYCENVVVFEDMLTLDKWEMIC